MYVTGYQFKVLSPVFTGHWGLQTRKTRPAWRERQNSANRKQFETFKKEVFARYMRDPLKMMKNANWRKAHRGSHWLETPPSHTFVLRPNIEEPKVELGLWLYCQCSSRNVVNRFEMFHTIEQVNEKIRPSKRFFLPILFRNRYHVIDVIIFSLIFIRIGFTQSLFHSLALVYYIREKVFIHSGILNHIYAKWTEIFDEGWTILSFGAGTIAKPY